MKAEFDRLEKDKTDLADKKAAKAAEEAAAAALTELAGNITSKGQAKTALETAIGGLDDDIAAQQAIIDAGNEGESAYDAAVTEKARLEGVKTTKQGELETVTGELEAFNTEKAGKDKQNAKDKLMVAKAMYDANHVLLNDLMKQQMKISYL